MFDFLRSPSIEWMMWLILGQLKVVMLMAVFTVGLLVYRRWCEQHLRKLQAVQAEILVGELLSNLDEAAPEVPTVKLKKPGRYAFLRAEVMRELLLEHIRSLSGFEREFLCRRYKELGFFDRDLVEIRSRFWWRRLAAVSHLKLLNISALAPLFYEMRHDRHDLVVAYSLLAMSALPHEINDPALLPDFPRSVLERRNVMLEIVRNWADLHGAEQLIEQTEKSRNPWLLSILISALSTLQSPDVARVFTEILDRKLFTYPAEAIEQMILLLKTAGDPECVPVVKRYLKHPSENIRRRAVELLVALGDEDLAKTFLSVNGDASTVVQRELKKWHERKVA